MLLVPVADSLCSRSPQSLIQNYGSKFDKFGDLVRKGFFIVLCDMKKGGLRTVFWYAYLSCRYRTIAALPVQTTDNLVPDPDPACHFDADPDPGPTFHFDTDPDRDPSFQIKAQDLEKVLK